jgi:hypothetical protein
MHGLVILGGLEELRVAAWSTYLAKGRGTPVPPDQDELAELHPAGNGRRRPRGTPWGASSRTPTAALVVGACWRVSPRSVRRGLPMRPVVAGAVPCEGNGRESMEPTGCLSPVRRLPVRYERPTRPRPAMHSAAESHQRAGRALRPKLGDAAAGGIVGF